jgi:hypothetical protein
VRAEPGIGAPDLKPATSYLPKDLARDATLSEDRVYRYQLVRSTGYRSQAVVNFVGLNPSTADECSDDPTVRRLIGFARRHAFGFLILTNLYAFRVTDPRALKFAADPIGPENFTYLAAAASNSQCIVPCWGAHGALQGRGREVLELLQRIGDIRVFGLTKGGEPMHPLYLAYEKALTPWVFARAIRR